MEQVFNLSSGHLLFIQDCDEGGFDYTIYTNPGITDIDGGIYETSKFEGDTPITIEVAEKVLAEACRDNPTLAKIDISTVKIEISTKYTCDDIRNRDASNLEALELLTKYYQKKISVKELHGKLEKLFSFDTTSIVCWIAENSAKALAHINC